MKVSRLGFKLELLCCQPTPQPQQLGIWAASATYSIAQGSAGSLTHWVRPDMGPTSSRILVGLVTAEPQQKLPYSIFWWWISKFLMSVPSLLKTWWPTSWKYTFLGVQKSLIITCITLHSHSPSALLILPISCNILSLELPEHRFSHLLRH